MRRRDFLWVAACGVGLAACTVSGPSSNSLRTPSVGATRDTSRSGDGDGDRDPSARGGDIDLQIKPIETTGRLAAQTGACDLEGVIVAHGSVVLAAQSCARELQMEEDIGGAFDFEAVTAIRDGRVKHLSGDTAAARAGYEQAVREDAQGRDPGLATHVAGVNLGLLDYEAGDAAAAQERLLAVLAEADDPGTRGAAQHNLALVYLELGDTDAALAAALAARDLLSNAAGPSHASVGAALNALGVIHAERGDLEDAIVTLEAAVLVRRHALGSVHPAVAASYTNLGIARARQNQWQSALQAHRDALAIDVEVLGPEHPITAADHAHVGESLLSLGEHRAARSSFRRSLAILEPVRPADDPELNQLRLWIAACTADTP